MTDAAAKSRQRRLQEQIRGVRQRIVAACQRAGRDPAGVRLVAVTKNVDLEVVRAAVNLGLTDLAENRVQDLTHRAAMLAESIRRRQMLSGGHAAPLPVWHMIGHLQRNKVRSLLGWTRIVHSLDSVPLAESLSQEAERRQEVTDVFLQVNVSRERSKFGVAVGAVEVLVDQIRAMPGLRLVGLMTLAPLVEDPERVRPVFARLAELSQDLRQRGVVPDSFRELSMGMSNDFEIACEEGATMVRIGSALFAGGT